MTALVSDCDHFWDYPKSFVLKPLQATTQTKSAEEIGQTVVKEFVQDKLIKKYVKFQAGRDLLIIRQTVVVVVEIICTIHLDEHLEREVFPISLSIAMPNGSLRKPSAK